MSSVSSIEKDSITTTQHYFKDCIFASKISNQMHATFAKRKVSQPVITNFVKKWLFYKTYFLYNVCAFTCDENCGKHSSSTLYLIQSPRKLLNGYLYYSSFTRNFLNRFFLELLFLAIYRKIKKFINKN